MGETMGALGQKADVKSRVAENVSQKKDAVVGTLSSGKDAVVGGADAVVSRVTGAVPDGQQVRAGADQVKSGAAEMGVSKQNPLGLMIGGAAVGFLAGLLAPTTRVEDERMGEIADQVKDSAKESAQEMLQHGKQVAQEVASTAKETASEQTSQHAEEMADSLKQSAREVAPTGGGSS